MVREELAFLLGFPTFIVVFVAITDMLMGRPVDLPGYAFGFAVAFAMTLATILLMGLPRLGRTRAHRPLFAPLVTRYGLRLSGGSIMSAPSLTGTIDSATVSIMDSLGRTGRSPSLEIEVRGAVPRPVHLKPRSAPSLAGLMPPQTEPMTVGAWSVWGISRGDGSRALLRALDGQDPELRAGMRDGELVVRTVVSLSSLDPQSLMATVRQLVALHAAVVSAARAPADPEEARAARQIRSELDQMRERT